MRCEKYLIPLITLNLLAGCEVYHKKPLTPDAVQKALTPPSSQEIREQAEKIKHPILKPIEIDESRGLSPEEAAVVAVLVNPQLRAVRDQRDIAQAELIQAGILPNPQLSYSNETPTGGATKGAVSAWGFGLDWDISELISHGASVKSAKAEKAGVDLDVAWQEWQVAEGAKAAVYNLTALNAEVALARVIDERLRENKETVQRAAAKGLLTAIDLNAAIAASDSAHAQFLDLQKQAEQQRLDLNYLLGQPASTQVKIISDLELPNHFTPPAEQDLINGMEDRRLDLVALRKGYEAQDQAFRAAILQQFPKIDIGLIHARDTSDVITTGFGVNISLPIFDRNQGQVALEKATRQMLFDEYTDRVFSSRSDISKMIAGIDALNGQIAAAQEAEPDLQKLADSYRMAASRGEADILSYYSAWNTLNQKQMEILTLEQELANARIGLEVLAGFYQIETASAPTEGAQ